MDLLQSLAMRIALNFLDSAITAQSVDAELAVVKSKIEELVAKSETKFDDKLLSAIERVLAGNGVLKVIEKELIDLAASFAASTENPYDDQVVAIFKKALGV